MSVESADVSSQIIGYPMPSRFKEANGQGEAAPTKVMVAIDKKSTGVKVSNFSNAIMRQKRHLLDNQKEIDG